MFARSKSFFRSGRGLPGVLCQAKTPEEIAATIAPLISENTVCVVFCDITTLEPEQIVQSLKSFIDVVRDAGL